MPRKPTFTEQTNVESHALFKEAVSQLGQGTDPRTERRHHVFVDGVSLGDRQNEMRRSNTSYYEQTFAEANAVAHAAINLDLDKQGRVDVLRLKPPMPDAELKIDGSTIAFVEQTMAMDQAARQLSLNVEALNAAARSCKDPVVQAAFAAGMLNIRLNVIPPAFYASGLPISDILSDIVRLVHKLDGDTRPIKPDKALFPLLASMNAFASYHAGGKTGAPVMMLVDHGRAELFEDAFVTQLRKKREKAAGYPSSCRPLWLLLDIDMHFGWRDYSYVARDLIEAESPTEYDRIIVQQTWFSPLIVDLSPRGEGSG